MPLLSNEEEHPQLPPHCIPYGTSTALYPAPHPMPAIQLLHVDPPTIELHVPAAHAVHTLEIAALNVPALQSIQTIAPAALYVPAVQSVQTVAPTAALYVPARHGTHVLALSAAPYVPAAQFSHVFADVAPTAALDVPARQIAQLSAPTVALYVPAMQLEQVLIDTAATVAQTKSRVPLHFMLRPPRFAALQKHGSACDSATTNVLDCRIRRLCRGFHPH